MKLKQLLSCALSCLMAVTALTPSTASAQEIMASQQETELSDQLTASDGNSFGSLLTEQIEQTADERDDALFGNGCNISDVTVEGDIAHVVYQTKEMAMLVVALYDEQNTQLLALGTQLVTPESTQADVEFQIAQMPTYFFVKAYLVDPDSKAPLSQVFDTPFYTQQWVEFFSKTTADFSEERVLNFDDSTTTNFAVFSEEVIRIQEIEGQNLVISTDDATHTFVFEHPSEQMLELVPGDRMEYTYGEDGLILADVKSVSLDGEQLTVVGEPIDVNVFFEHIRVDEHEQLLSSDTGELCEDVSYYCEEEALNILQIIALTSW